MPVSEKIKALIKALRTKPFDYSETVYVDGVPRGMSTKTMNPVKKWQSNMQKDRYHNIQRGMGEE